MTALDWIAENREWLFSGAGVAVLAGLWALLRRRTAAKARSQSQQTGAGSAGIQVGRDLRTAGSIWISAAGTASAEESERRVLQEVVGKLAPAVSTIMNAACSPKDLAALREDMRRHHERLDELSAMFVNDPDTERAIKLIGQAGGAAVSASPNVGMKLFEMHSKALLAVKDALKRRSN